MAFLLLINNLNLLSGYNMFPFIMNDDDIDDIDDIEDFELSLFNSKNILNNT